QPAAGGNHLTALRGDQPERLVLGGAEVRLAPGGEDLRNGHAFPGLYHVVRLDEAAPQPPGEYAADRGLARPHEAHQDHVVPHGLTDRSTSGRLRRAGRQRWTVVMAGVRRWAQSDA